MRYCWAIVAILLLSTAGCGPALSEGDLGEMVSELPKVAGADEPYQMPQLSRPAADEEGEMAKQPRSR